MYSASPPASPTLPPQESIEFDEIRQKLKDLELDQAVRYINRDKARRMGKEEKDDMLLDMLQEKDDLVDGKGREG